MPLNGAATRRGLHWCQPSDQAFAGKPAPTDHFAHFVEAEVGAPGALLLGSGGRHRSDTGFSQAECFLHGSSPARFFPPQALAREHDAFRVAQKEAPSGGRAVQRHKRPAPSEQRDRGSLRCEGTREGCGSAAERRDRPAEPGSEQTLRTRSSRARPAPTGKGQAGPAPTGRARSHPFSRLRTSPPRPCPRRYTSCTPRIWRHGVFPR
jgi:hypothetical protein